MYYNLHNTFVFHFMVLPESQFLSLGDNSHLLYPWMSSVLTLGQDYSNSPSFLYKKEESCSVVLRAGNSDKNSVQTENKKEVIS